MKHHTNIENWNLESLINVSSLTISTNIHSLTHVHLVTFQPNGLNHGKEKEMKTKTLTFLGVSKRVFMAKSNPVMKPTK